MKLLNLLMNAVCRVFGVKSEESRENNVVETRIALYKRKESDAVKKGSKRRQVKKPSNSAQRLKKLFSINRNSQVPETRLALYKEKKVIKESKTRQRIKKLISSGRKLFGKVWNQCKQRIKDKKKNHH